MTFMLLATVTPITMREGTAGAVNPLDQKRELMELLSQETRHQIIQTLLGHPKHLASVDELNYMVANKSRKAITDALETLVDAGILDEYRHPPNEKTRDYPWIFYGLTEYGVDVLADFGYLKGLPFARAVYKQTATTERVERHQAAPRPALPDVVREYLQVDEDELGDEPDVSDAAVDHALQD